MAQPATPSAVSLNDASRSYATRIRQYAATWKGGNYKGLAWYTAQRPSRKPSAPFPAVIVGTVFPDGSRTLKEYVNQVIDLVPVHQTHSNPTSESLLHIVHLRGLLPSDSIVEIGSSLSVDPEYFRRHLDFLQLGKRNHYDQSTSPSLTRRFPCFKLNTICTRQQPIRSSDVASARKQERGAVYRYRREITTDIISGEPIVRRYSVLNESVVALEQTVSVTIKHRKNGDCYIILWFDNGRNIYKSKLQRLLLGHQQLKTDMPRICIPVVEHKPLAALDLDDTGASLNAADATDSIWQQSADELANNYGASLDQRLMKIDAMYAISELLALCHGSEMQFLNAVESCVDDAMQGSEGREETSLGSLTYLKRLLDEHISYLQKTILFIEGPKTASWPAAREEADMAVVKKTAVALLSDYADALDRAKTIAARAMEGTGMLINASMLKESKKGILQAESTTRLSLLAVFFLPINLVTSFFGMNFKQFGQGPLHIWISFACMGVMLLIASILLVGSKAVGNRGGEGIGTKRWRALRGGK